MLDPWEKSSDQARQHIKKQRHYFANKYLVDKAMVFLVFTYGCESWTINKLSTEELMLLNMCWIRLLRFRWAARRSNKSNIKEISPEYPLEGLMLKLKLQYFGHQMQRNDLPEKILMLLAPSSFAFHSSQNQVFSFQWVGFSHQVAKFLELRFQHQSFQWIFSIDFF